MAFLGANPFLIFIAHIRCTSRESFTDFSYVFQPKSIVCDIDNFDGQMTCLLVTVEIIFSLEENEKKKSKTSNFQSSHLISQFCFFATASTANILLKFFQVWF